ncbi:hypothetical protein TD95_003632 [Thielaviopsis punctulata]|uniref:DUF6590 domain-containing protein n=1 Tax=Thielaviopsis punctulata TaxID=72032 RepID=A0A0F4ZJ20_9PEZI|nr:hypothetical protein TD95_003632 [Thielaviopsis punctulata]
MPWSDYGPWIWHPTYQRYYRQRQNHLGERETDWAPVANVEDVSTEHIVEAPPPVPSAIVPEEGEKKKKRRRRRGKGKNKSKARESDSESDSEAEAYHELHNTAYPPFSSPPAHDADDSGYINEEPPNFYADSQTDDDPLIIESDTDSLHIDPVPQQLSAHYAEDPGANVISTEPETGQAWVLDPRYRIHSSHEFQPGEVFKILWSEPIGKTATGAASVSDSRTYVDSYGEKFYVGFRRFIVVANDAGHCTCVPILTYGGRGCKKNGVKPDRHGIVVQTGHSPRLIPGEPMLGFPPIHIDIHAKGERLAKESRVNYSKLVTIEHNVKVFFVGSVIAQDADQMQDAVNECWRRKSFHRRSNA